MLVYADQRLIQILLDLVVAQDVAGVPETLDDGCEFV